MTEPGTLLALQSVDLELIRAAKRLDELPEKAAILATRAKRREVASMRDKAAMLVRKLEAEVKSRQDEIETLTAKIEGEQSKIMETSDHRQVQALTREMDGLKRRVDKLEMEEMQFLERVEKAESQVKTVDAALEAFAEKEAELVKHFKVVGGALQDEIAQMQAERSRLAKAMDPHLLAHYEEVRSSKGGVGVGRLDGDTCTACHMSLPAERIRDLNNGDDVGICPACRRLIVVRGGDPA